MLIDPLFHQITGFFIHSHTY